MCLGLKKGKGKKNLAVESPSSDRGGECAPAAAAAAAASSDIAITPRSESEVSMHALFDETSE